MNIIEIHSIYCPQIKSLAKISNGLTYRAMLLEANPAAFKKENMNAEEAPKNIRHIREIYTLGIVERCHLACITSLVRGERWLTNTTESIINQNVLAFSASLRGFLEAAADAHDVLQFLPATLQKLFPYLYAVLNECEQIDGVIINIKDLEDRLIHYAYAQRQDRRTTPPPNHTNKSNQEYIQVFERFGVAGLGNLYSELCQLTHPAAPSISCFYDERDNYLHLNFSKDELIISGLLERYEDTIQNLISYSFNYALCGLSLINRLVPDWPAPSDAGLSSVGKWPHVLNEIDQFTKMYKSGSYNSESLLQLISSKAQ